VCDTFLIAVTTRQMHLPNLKSNASTSGTTSVWCVFVTCYTEQNRNIISLELKQFLVTLHTYTTVYNFGDTT